MLVFVAGELMVLFFLKPILTVASVWNNWETGDINSHKKLDKTSTTLVMLPVTILNIKFSGFCPQTNHQRRIWWICCTSGCGEIFNCQSFQVLRLCYFTFFAFLLCILKIIISMSQKVRTSFEDLIICTKLLPLFSIII